MPPKKEAAKPTDKATDKKQGKPDDKTKANPEKAAPKKK
eukprot:CAMPEP_0114289090 /NCGR_PEP_ID=MMETSP0059-20121206/7175_1 /TAXON_ID=36894 /ORGANISM="Pyramimonas parkeae, Strain CCMP726" /LENGTH=38 /DNA_ID= /DNA_START= /DNA_END= /DNA_ORIENTATION=